MSSRPLTPTTRAIEVEKPKEFTFRPTLFRWPVTALRPNVELKSCSKRTQSPFSLGSL